MSELNIISCPDDPNEALIPLEGTVSQGDRDSAVREFKEQFPTTTPSALCQKGDSYFLRASQLGIIEAPPQDNPKEQLIRDILNARVNINLYDMRTQSAEVDLATRLQTLQTMKSSGTAGSASKLPIETLLWEVASAAIAFGLVTEAFKDAASFLEISFKYLGGLASLFEKKHQMQRIMIERNLCAGSSPPSNMLGNTELMWKSFPLLLVGGVATYGLIQLGKGQSPENPQRAEGQNKEEGGELLGIASGLFDIEELRGKTVSELTAMNEQLTDELADKSRRFEEANATLKEVSGQIISASMAELKKRDLGAVEDEDIQAYARSILAQEEGGADPLKFISETGSHLLAIGLGFGVGTHVLSGAYRSMAPWRLFIDKNVEVLKKQARREAEKTISQLLDTKVLRQCDKGEQEREAQDVVQKTGPVERVAEVVKEPADDESEPVNQAPAGQAPAERHRMEEIEKRIEDIQLWRTDFKRYLEEHLRHWYNVTGIDEMEKHAIDSLLETMRGYLDRANAELREGNMDKALRCFRSIEVIMTDLSEMADRYSNTWGDGEVNRIIAYGAGSAATLVALTAGGWVLLGGGSLVGGGTATAGATYTTATGTTLTVINGGSAPIVGAVTAAQGSAGLKVAVGVALAMGGVASQP